MNRAAIALMMLLLPVPTAAAADWELILAESRIAFAGVMLGAPVAGTFPSFAATFSFDPAAPEAAQIRLVVTLADLSTNHRERDIALASLEWFDAGAFPIAEFVSLSVTSLASDRLVFSGDLTVKGETRPLLVETVLSMDGANRVADGTFVMNRHDFALGTGGWSNDAIVGATVTVTFHLVAKRR